MSLLGVQIHPGTYLDSLLLMVASTEMTDATGVEWAGAVMATPRGLGELRSHGFGGGELTSLGANDLVLAVVGADQAAVDTALDLGRRAVFSELAAESFSDERDEQPRSMAEAALRNPGANVAIVSVPGEYAALEAHHALTAGLHVLLFSDGVSVDEEIELKDRGEELGLFVMGPGAGTAVLAGTGLGFANAVSAGRVGVVAAAGTGAQEVAALLTRWGVGISQVIGVGGRDLSEAVDGRMARAAVRTLDRDPETDAILLVSKPPSPGVAARVLAECASTPAVAVFLGLAEMRMPPGVTQARTLETGALVAARLAGAGAKDLTYGLRGRAAAACSRLAPGRSTVRGLFSGGTLCYEAQLILGDLLGPVFSNEPLDPERALPAPDHSHVLLDLGAEEYTRGRPHPMIDPSSRLEMLRVAAREPDVAVILVDVVLGYGSHADPGRVLAPVCAEVMDAGGPQVVVYLLGTDLDPQGYASQRATLESAGCLVTETNARAAYVAAAIACRQPDVCTNGLTS
jgi:FdrA protein